MDYIYDGTFEGLLTCIFLHYKKQATTGIYNIKSYQQSMINNYEIVITNRENAKIVSEAINNKISREAYLYIYYAFLSCMENKENIILDFIVFAFKYGKNTMNFYSHEKVLPINEIHQKVGKESHRFKGILRFKDINGLLYAKFSPDNDILVLITDHFANRYRYEKFIIHDEKRQKAVIYANDKWEIIENIQLDNFDESKDEKLFQSLWKQYFNDLAIEERKNIGAQFQFVPARYRKNMVEFKN